MHDMLHRDRDRGLIIYRLGLATSYGAKNERYVPTDGQRQRP